QSRQPGADRIQRAASLPEVGARPAAANFSSPAKNRKARFSTESFNFLGGSVRACEVATEAPSENTNPKGEDRSERIVQAAGECARIVGIAEGLVRVAKQPFVETGPNQRVAPPVKIIRKGAKLHFLIIFNSLKVVLTGHRRIAKEEV